MQTSHQDSFRVDKPRLPGFWGVYPPVPGFTRLQHVPAARPYRPGRKFVAVAAERQLSFRGHKPQAAPEACEAWRFGAPRENRILGGAYKELATHEGSNRHGVRF